MAELTLRYFSAEGESYGRLVVAVRSGTFCGEGSMWVSPEYVKENFVAPLRKYPLAPRSFPYLEGGNSIGDPLREQKHVSISIKPYDALGTLLVHTQLATDFQTSPDKEMQHTLTARFLTEYAALAQFASEVVQVVEKNRDVAALCGFEGRHQF